MLLRVFLKQTRKLCQVQNLLMQCTKPSHGRQQVIRQRQGKGGTPVMYHPQTAIIQDSFWISCLILSI